LNYPDHLLYQVSRPARYTGGEFNVIRKDWNQTPLKIALSYPDIYEIGMSNMAVGILYEQINTRPDALAERVFAPWTDMIWFCARTTFPSSAWRAASAGGVRCHRLFAGI
jgi:hypothetical protein